MTNRSDVNIREDSPLDFASVQRVVTESFTTSPHGYHGEADLVARLRANCNHVLSLVAMDEQELIGHVLFSSVQIRTASMTIEGSGLAPVSVQPARQRTGVGTALINAGLEQLESNHIPFVVVIGDPAYYGRFGFQAAADFQLNHTFDGIPQEYLMVRWLQPGVVGMLSGGTVHYHGEFNA